MLSPQQIEDASGERGAGQGARDAGFEDRTPLWYYVLAQAEALREGRRLGPVGSTIVAEVLVGLVRRSPDSVLNTNNPGPDLPAATPGEFTLSDLLRFAGVLP